MTPFGQSKPPIYLGQARPESLPTQALYRAIDGLVSGHRVNLPERYDYPDPALASMLDRLVEDELERLDGARTAARVRRMLQAASGLADPRREQIAAALHLSDRTLQRRLQEEGTSFQRLLDETRRERAQLLLRQPQTSLKRAAELLGFEDQSNLVRACRRWFGLSPGQYRSRFCSAGMPAAPRLAGHPHNAPSPSRPPG